MQLPHYATSDMNREIRYRRYTNRTKWERFKCNLYDPETQEVFGRNRRAWRNVLVFYMVFLAVLIIFSALCGGVIMLALDYVTPARVLEDSLIGTNPGVAFRPMSDNLDHGTVIQYSIGSEASVKRWVKLLDDFLAPYYTQGKGENVISCSPTRYPRDNEVCIVKPDFGDCSKSVSPDYGYGQGSPCVFIKLNKIFSWIPNLYTKPVAGMPPELNSSILRQPEAEREKIWVSCSGQNNHDKDNAKVFTYAPRGFADYYYPYRNQKNYLNPLVAVKIHNPTRNVLVNIECRAWARNIIYVRGKSERQGSTVFTLLIEDFPKSRGKKGLRFSPKTY